MSKYRQTPPQITGFPRGIPFIVGNELAERFSFYGMKSILTIFMTKHLLDASGASAAMSVGDSVGAATVYQHQVCLKVA